MILSFFAFFGYIGAFFVTWHMQRQGNRKAKKIFELMQMKSTIKEDLSIMRQIWFILTDQGRARDRLLASQKRHSEPLVYLFIALVDTTYYSYINCGIRGHPAQSFRMQCRNQSVTIFSTAKCLVGQRCVWVRMCEIKLPTWQLVLLSTTSTDFCRSQCQYCFSGKFVKWRLT